MDQPRMLVLLTLYHDHDAAVKMLETLEGCKEPFDLMVLDACTDSSSSRSFPTDWVDFPKPDTWPVQGVYAKIYGPQEPGGRAGLPQCLNDGIDFAIEKGYETVAWIHPDMDFSEDPDVLHACSDFLTKIQEEQFRGSYLTPRYWKASPREFTTRADLMKAALKEEADLDEFKIVEGNACPWVALVSALEQYREITGYVFDPEYFLMIYEDHDLINGMFTVLGMRPAILPYLRVIHTGMGTRNKFLYGNAFEKNQDLHRKKWGTTGFLFPPDEGMLVGVPVNHVCSGSVPCQPLD